MRDWLVKARKDSGMSQKAVCDAVGIAQPTYWEYEHDDCAPSPQIAIKLGSILGFDWVIYILVLPSRAIGAKPCRQAAGAGAAGDGQGDDDGERGELLPVTTGRGGAGLLLI